MSQDCWHVLGITSTDDQELIRQAYRQLLPQFHPETDAEGFSRLRQAYDQARKLATSGLSTPVAIPTPDISQAPAPVASSSSEAAILLAEFSQLLCDPRRRYDPACWQQFIYQIDQHGLNISNDIRWKLLDLLLNDRATSAHCANLLAERFNWRQRISEIPAVDQPSILAYLQNIAEGDVFDLAILAELSLPAQIELYNFIQIGQQLFWEQPYWVLHEHLNQPRVLYWPADLSLLNLLARWYQFAQVPSSLLRDHCLQQLQQQPDNSDWLHLAAQHCSLLADNDLAAELWLKLYQQQQHGEAAQWLLSWCAESQRDFMPLLIKAMDSSDYPDSASLSVEDEQQQYLLPGQKTSTLIRLGIASQLEFAPIAQSYLDWQLGLYRPAVMFPHLVTDNGSDPLTLLYRLASLLELGNEVLLQQVIDHPLPADLLQRFIVTGLQRQAQQRLIWLKNSSVLTSFSEWLLHPSDHPLPDAFADTESVAFKQSLLWLWHWRALPAHSLRRLLETEVYQNNLDSINDWLAFLVSAGQLDVPLPHNKDNAWDQYRQAILLYLMLGQGAAHVNEIRQLDNLSLGYNHPGYSLFQVFKHLDPAKGELLEQLKQKLQLNQHLHYHCWTRLPVDPENYIDNWSECSFLTANYFYQNVQQWQEQLVASPTINQALFHSFYFYHGTDDLVQSHEHDLTGLTVNEGEEQDFKRRLLQMASLEAFAQAPFAARGPLLWLAELNLRMRADQQALLTDVELQRLEQQGQNQQLDIALRLTAILLLQLHLERVRHLRSQGKPRTPFWMVFYPDTAVSRRGFAAQVGVGTAICFVLGHIIQHEALFWMWVAILLNLFSALIRRGNDLQREKPKRDALLSIIFPPLILYYLFKKAEDNRPVGRLARRR